MNHVLVDQGKNISNAMESYLKVAAGIILKGDKVLIAKRLANKHQGDLWEFPGGKVETNESPLQALKRELKEEVNLDIKQADLYQDIQFNYPDKNVHLFFFMITDFSGDENGLEGQEICWVALDDLKQYEFPEANKKIVTSLSNQV